MLIADGVANRPIFNGIFAIDLSDSLSWNDYVLNSVYYAPNKGT